ncbi:ABC transporter ATP-binding protein [Streptococcus dentasini]
MNKIAIEIRQLSKDFQIAKNKKIEVLKDISFTTRYGEFISILGISGSGKSTLLNCISSLSEPSQGEVKINHRNPYQLSNGRLSKLRREEIGFIFQSYNLVPALPVIENIALPLRLSHKKVDKDTIKALLDHMNFQADLMAPVSTLSGGEKQRVAIARTLLSDSQIVFADEPTGALDSSSRTIIFDMLRELANQGRCVIMVTHDIELASQTDRALILRDGRLDQELLKPSAELLYQALEVKDSEAS